MKYAFIPYYGDKVKLGYEIFVRNVTNDDSLPVYDKVDKIKQLSRDEIEVSKFILMNHLKNDLCRDQAKFSLDFHNKSLNYWNSIFPEV